MNHLFRVCCIGLSCLGMTGCVLKAISNAPNMSSTYQNPVGGDAITMGDPYVLLHEDVYYLYGTTDGLPGKKFKVWASRDLVDWKVLGYSLQLDDDSWSRHLFWAPEVIEKNERFYMTYSARNADSGPFKLCLAVADTPEGPYHEYAAPLFDDGSSCWDGHIFIDTDGTPYLYYTSEKESYGVRLSDDLKQRIGASKLILPIDQAWEQPAEAPEFWCTEGPFVIREGDDYYMTYSGNHYASPLYAIGYATAKHPLGPWTKAAENPIVATDPAIPISGPGHCAFTRSPDGSELFMVYHAHKNGIPGWRRSVHADRAEVADGTLRLIGPTADPRPLPSGTVDAPLPAHLVEAHAEFTRADNLRQAVSSVRRSLERLPAFVEGRPLETELVWTNPSHLPITVHLEWQGVGQSPKRSGDFSRQHRDTVAAATATSHSLSPRSEQTVTLHLQPPFNNPSVQWQIASDDNAARDQGRIEFPVAKVAQFGDEALPIHVGDAEVRLQRESEGLHISANVKDSSIQTGADAPHENDSIEFYFDLRDVEERGKLHTYTDGAFQITVVAGGNKGHLAPQGTEIAGIQVRSDIDTDGYRIQVFLPESTYAIPEEFHFDVAHNAVDTKGQRLQSIFSGTPNNWADPRHFARMSPDSNK